MSGEFAGSLIPPNGIDGHGCPGIQISRGVPVVRGDQVIRGGPVFRGGAFRGIPQVRSGNSPALGSARFVTKPAWIGPPYTQVSPFPSAQCQSLLKRKKENVTGTKNIFEKKIW